MPTSSRCRSSAATRVNVTGKMLSGSKPSSSNRATRRFIANDLPVPGPATTRMRGLREAAMAWAGVPATISSDHDMTGAPHRTQSFATYSCGHITKDVGVRGLDSISSEAFRWVLRPRNLWVLRMGPDIAAPINCATMNPGTSLIAMPAKVVVKPRERHRGIGERSRGRKPIGCGDGQPDEPRDRLRRAGRRTMFAYEKGDPCADGCRQPLPRIHRPRIQRGAERASAKPCVCLNSATD